jgi:MoaA/NifB/PqqE/SkfB family radical SAM enzyme
MLTRPKTYEVVHFMLTKKCNLNCKHCLYNSGKDKNEELTTSEMIKIVKSLNKLNIKHIHLEGGEPFLRKDFGLILKEFKTLNNITIVTNGTIPYSNKFKVLKENNISSVMFSLDNFARPKEAQYEKVIKNLLKFKKAQIPIKIRTTINKKNIGFIEEITKLALKLEIPLVRFGVYQSLGKGSQKELLDKWKLEEKDYIILFNQFYKTMTKYKDQLNLKLSVPASIKTNSEEVLKLIQKTKLKEYMKFLKCFAFHKRFTIHSNGNVTQCLQSCSPVVLGNIKTESLNAILLKENKFKKGHSCNQGHIIVSSNNKSHDLQ